MFGRRQGTGDPVGESHEVPVRGHPCPSLAKALDRALRAERPRILDLGPLCGDTVTELAGRGARVTVEEFEPPPAPPEDDAAGDEAPPAPLRIDQPDSRFDLVLAWEHIDFVPPERLDEFFGELRRVTAPGGVVLLLSRSTGEDGPDHPARHRLLADDRLVREAIADRELARWVHPTRRIEQALGELVVEGIHLQRDQTREFLIVRQQASQPSPRAGQGSATPERGVRPARTGP